MNRNEIYNKAVELRAQSGPIGAMITAIDEANNELKNAHSFMSIFIAQQAANADRFQAVSPKPIIDWAILYANAGAKLDTLFMTLAIMLEQKGIEVNY